MSEEPKNEQEVVSFRQQEWEEIRRKARQQARRKKHNWVQRGPWLVCTSCDFPHGVYIGPDKIMVARDREGNPVLKSRGELARNGKFSLAFQGKASGRTTPRRG